MELETLNEIPKCCNICLFEVDSLTPVKFIWDEEEKWYKSMNGLKETLKCTSCRTVVHKICLFDPSATTFTCSSCCNSAIEKKPSCIICGQKNGEIKDFEYEHNKFSAHLLCLYFSKRFILCNDQLIPHSIKSLQNLTPQMEKTCMNCRQPLNADDTYFACFCGCGSVAHVFCILWEKVSALREGTYIEEVRLAYPAFSLKPIFNENDYQKLELDELALSHIFEEFKPFFEKTQDIKKSIFENKRTIEVSLKKSVFQMKCIKSRNFETDEIFCCLHKKDDVNFTMCSICSLWYHELPECMDFSVNEGKNWLAKNAKKLKKHGNRKNKAAENAEKGEREEDKFVGCNLCFEVYIHLHCDKKVSYLEKKLKKFGFKNHEHPAVNFIVRNVLFNEYAKSNGNLSEKIVFLDSHYFLKTEIIQFMNAERNIKFIEEKITEKDEIVKEIIHFNEKILNATRLSITVLDNYQLEIERFRKRFNEIRSSHESLPNALITIESLNDVLNEMKRFLMDEISKKEFIKNMNNTVKEKFVKTKDNCAKCLIIFINDMVYNPLNQAEDLIYQKAQTLNADTSEDYSKFTKHEHMIAICRGKLQIEHIKYLENRFKENPFCLKYFEIYRNFPSLSLPTQRVNFIELGELERRLKQYLDWKIHDKKNEPRMKSFLNFLILAHQEREKDQILYGKFETMKRIGGIDVFLQDFNTNMEKLILLPNLAEIETFKAYKVDQKKFDLLERSKAFNLQIKDQIFLNEHSEIEIEQNCSVSKLLNQILENNFAISREVFQFLKNSEETLQLKGLFDNHEGLQPEKFKSKIQAFEPYNFENDYSIKILGERMERVKILNEEIDLALKEEIFSNNFLSLKRKTEDWIKQQEELKHSNENLLALQASFNFWDALCKECLDFNGKIDFTEKMIFSLKEEIQQLSLTPLRKLIKHEIFTFYFSEIKDLYILTNMRHLDEEINHIIKNKHDCPSMALMNKMKSRYGKNIGCFTKVLNNRKSCEKNLIIELFENCTQNQEKLLNLCFKFMKGNYNIKEIRVDLLVGHSALQHLEYFKIDIEDFEENIIGLYIIFFILKMSLELLKFTRKTQFIEEIDSDSLAQLNFEESFDESKIPQTPRRNFHRFNENFRKYNIYRKLLKKKSIKMIESHKWIENIFIEFEEKFDKFRNDIQGYIPMLKELQGYFENQALSQKFVFSEIINCESIFLNYPGICQPAIKYVNQIKDKFYREKGECKIILDEIAELDLRRVGKSKIQKDLKENEKRILNCYIYDEELKDYKKLSTDVVALFRNNMGKSDALLKILNSINDTFRVVFPGHYRSIFLQEIVQTLKRMETVSQEINSLFSKILSKQEFKDCIVSAINFKDNSHIRSCFSFESYETMKKELYAIKMIVLEEDTYDYLKFIKNYTPSVILPEAYSQLISRIKRGSEILSEYFNKNFVDFSEYDKIFFYLLLQSDETKFNAFHSKTVRNFFKERENVRNDLESQQRCYENVEARKYELDKLLKEGIPEGGLFLENLYANKELADVSLRYEIVVLHLCYILALIVELRGIHCPAERLTQLIALNSLDKQLTDIGQNNSDRTDAMQVQICKETICYAVQSIQALDIKYKEFLQEDTVSNNIFHRYMDEFQNQSDYDYQTDKVKCTSFLNRANERFKELEKDLNDIKSDEIQKMKMKIFNIPSEQNSEKDLSKLFLTDLFKIELIIKTPEKMRLMHLLAKKLADWVYSSEINRDSFLGSNSKTRIDLDFNLTKRIKMDPSLNPMKSAQDIDCKIDLIRKYTHNLDRKPSLCQELEENNFASDYFIKKVEKSSKSNHLSLTHSRNEKNYNCQLQSTNNKSCITLDEKTQNFHSRPSYFDNFSDADLGSLSCNKKVKTEDPVEPIFHNPINCLSVLYWETKFISFFLDNKPLNFTVYTSLMPDLFPKLAKTSIHFRSEDSKDKKELKSGFQDFETTNKILKKSFNKIKEGKLNYSSFFGGWFKLSKNSDNKNSAKFWELLNHSRINKSFLHEIFSMSTHSWKMYIGSLAIVDCDILEYLEPRFDPFKNNSIDNYWIFIFHTKISQQWIKKEHSIDELFIPCSFKKVERDLEEADRLQGFTGEEELFAQLKIRAKKVLDSCSIR